MFTFWKCNQKIVLRQDSVDNIQHIDVHCYISISSQCYLPFIGEEMLKEDSEIVTGYRLWVSDAVLHFLL